MENPLSNSIEDERQIKNLESLELIEMLAAWKTAGAKIEGHKDGHGLLHYVVTFPSGKIEHYIDKNLSPASKARNIETMGQKWYENDQETMREANEDRGLINDLSDPDFEKKPKH